METNLRQAETNVTVLGILSEKELNVEDSDKGKKMTGHITIKVDDVNSVRFNINTLAKKKDGTDSALFKGLETIRDEYKSIAEAGLDDATRVSVTRGELNLYHDKQTGTSRVGFRSNFFNRINNPEFTPKAEFSVEMCINSIMPEVDNQGEETGRAIVSGWVPTYNGIEEIKLVAGEDLAGDVMDVFEAGQTVQFTGDIISGRAIPVEIPVKIGKPKIEYKPGKQELLITGASEEYPEEAEGTTPAAYPIDSIKAAVQERRTLIESEKAGATTVKATSKPSAASKGRSSAALF